ncbi:MAG: hypothetical protein AAGI34_14410 [Pseudomonadota bacterium]
MLARGFLLGSAAAMGAAMLVPGVAAVTARGVRNGLDLAASASDAAWAELRRRGADLPLQTQLRTALRRALAEAAEQAEDVLAEVSAELLPPEPAPPSEAALVPGYLAGTAPPPSVPGAQVAHLTSARVRLKLVDALSPSELERLADRLAAVPGVARVLVRAETRSIVLDSPDVPRLLDLLDTSGLLHLDRQAPARTPAAFLAHQILTGLDQLIRLRSRGSTDLHSVVAMVMVALAVLRRDPAARAMAERLARRQSTLGGVAGARR